MAEGRRLGHVEGHQRHICVYRPAVSAGELVPQSAECALRRARPGLEDRLGQAGRHRISLSVGLPRRGRRRRRDHEPRPLADRSCSNEVSRPGISPSDPLCRADPSRLIITSTTRGPRRTIALLRSLPSYLCPSGLVVPTVLHSLVHPVLALSTPLVLRTKFLIDSELSPATFSVAKFCSSVAALLIKLPLETVLRRGQVAVLSQPNYNQAPEGTAGLATSSKLGRHAGGVKTATHTPLETIVHPGRYQGVVGTMYAIVNEEGSRAVHAPSPASTKGKTASKKGRKTVAEAVYRRGQGLDGLWRGWKVNTWGLVGLWMASVAGGGGDGEF